MVSSLNATLARLSAIEGNFTALEGLSNKITQNYAVKNYSSSSPINKDFSEVLNKKDEEENIKKKIEESVEVVENFQPLKPSLKEKIENVLPQVHLKAKISAEKETQNIDKMISNVSSKYNVDENFIRAIIKQESGFNPKATSKAGAMGLMQLMPKTAQGLGVIDAYNPQENLEGGIKYIKSLMDKYQGDKRVALAAYNAGPTAVNRYGGIPPYKETQNYVKNIMAMYEKSNEVKL